ncbi:LysR family transcriptional regulator [Enterococcus sp. 2201sp1_2201st1_B8_2201SCRN_220225]|uniref:LysR family transcriptional regulator n=1 Tax=unclassified Enterococcus TaxID=2608891 RepID=UPI0034A4E53D
MLDYRYETFLVLAETLNYTQAAWQLNITQPAVTQHIHHLQDDLGVKLFSYQNRRLNLTAQGSYLLASLQTLMPEIATIRNNLLTSNSINIGCGRTIGEYFVFDKETPFAVFFERPDIALSIDTTNVLLSKIDNGEIDIGIVAGDLNPNKYQLTPLIKQEIVGIASPRNSGIKQTHHLTDLLSETLILREEGSGVMDILHQKLAAKQIQLSDFKNTNQIATTTIIKRMVARNKGISFLFAASVDEEIQKGLLVKIPLEPAISEYFFIATTKEKEQDPKIKKTIAQLIEAVAASKINE